MGTLSRANEFEFTHSNNLCSEEEEVEGDYFDGVYDYIKHMLMEEDDLEYRPCMFQESSALQAAEKYFHDALLSDNTNNSKSKSNPNPSFIDSQRSPLDSEICRWITDPLPGGSNDLNWLNDTVPVNHQTVVIDTNNNGNGNGNGNIESSSRRNKNSRRNGEDCGEEEEEQQERSGKQFAGNGGDDFDSEPIEKYDKSLLCPNMNPNFYSKPKDRHYEYNDEETNKVYRKSTQVKRGRPKGSNKGKKVNQVVDLRSMLTRCAQAVSNFDAVTAQELLNTIRRASSAYGDTNERLAHCFANSLEARILGTGSALYTAIACKKTPASELLKSYQAYVTSCPFKRMSNVFANKTIAKFTNEANKVHIIDFGILYGFQWPCIIHGISLRPGGPPMLKITGIDFPQPGFKPDERVKQTGNRLKSCCERFKVPFEYNAIAKKWDEIRLEDLKVEKDEMVVVNCMYRLRHVTDESVAGPSPRDNVLGLIKRINPDMFVHGVMNGTYNAPFFTTRFREALYHYSSFFDMMESTLPREDGNRFLYEREVFGRDIMNVIACEGSERVERPDTYKQWQVRVQRAGFTQVKISREILHEVKVKVSRGYHNDFMVEDDSEWMLQGWKGRVMYAISVWKPTGE